MKAEPASADDEGPRRGPLMPRLQQLSELQAELPAEDWGPGAHAASASLVDEAQAAAASPEEEALALAGERMIPFAVDAAMMAGTVLPPPVSVQVASRNRRPDTDGRTAKVTKGTRQRGKAQRPVLQEACALARLHMTLLHPCSSAAPVPARLQAWWGCSTLPCICKAGTALRLTASS
jgi:hypothetical protein